MRSTSEAPRVLAMHEAGHAVAMIRLGLLVKAVHMRTPAQVRTGDLIVDGRGNARKAQGMVEGDPHVNPGVVEALRAAGQMALPIHRLFAIVDIATLAAGPYAEARFSHRSVVDIELAGGGAQDVRAAQRIASLLPDPSEAFAEGWAKGRALVRSHWPAIVAVADLIQGRRYTDGEDIHSLLGEGD
jgi:hypothetical protein